MLVKVEPPKKDGSFIGALKYLERKEAQNHDLEKEEQVFYGNILVNNKEDAAALMEATASKSKRVKDPVLHFHLDWPKDEKPTEKQMMQSAKNMLKAIGMQNCQFCVVVHYDKDHPHCHVLVNRVEVCPLTDKVKTHNPHQMNSKLHKQARYEELENGWNHTKGLWSVVENNGKKKVVKTKSLKNKQNTKAKDMAVQSGIQPFDDWIEKSVAEEVYNFSSNAKSWEEIHSKLAEYNLKLVKYGRGLSIVDVDDYNKDPLKVKFKVKAQKIGNKFTKSSLEQQFGSEFTESKEINYKNLKPKAKYDDTITVGEANEEDENKKKENQALQNDFRLLCKYNTNKFKKPRSLEIKKVEKQAAKDINTLKNMVYAQQQEHMNRERAILGVKKLPQGIYNQIRSQYTFKRKQGIERITEEKQQKVDKVWEKYPKQLYENVKSSRERETFVREKAEDPDYQYREAAKRAVFGYDNKGSRAPKNYKPVAFACYIETVNTYTFRYKKNTDIFKHLESEITDFGVVYTANDQKVFTDRGSRIEFEDSAIQDTNSLEAGFLMAAANFKNSVSINGSPEYLDKMCRIAAKYDFVEVKNEELKPKIEQYRKELKEKWKHKDSSMKQRLQGEKHQTPAKTRNLATELTYVEHKKQQRERDMEPER